MTIAPPVPRRPGVPWWRSIRLRIALAVMLVSFAVSSAVGFVLAQQAATSALEAMRSEALGRLTVASDGYSLDGRLRYGAALDPASAPDAVRAELADPDVERRMTYYDGSTMWAAERLGPEVVLVVALDATSLDVQDEARLDALGWAALTSLLGSAVLGWAAGTTLSRRLRRAATAADAIAEGSPDARAGQGGHDEIARLTGAVDDMADALGSRLAAEQEFTADVAHELRTPMTGLVSAAELLPEGEVTDLVRQQVDRLRRLIEDLLEVSRLDRGTVAAELVEVDLGVAVRASLDRLASQHRVAALDLQVGGTDRVSLDERRLDRVLGNLIGNLARHGGGTGTLRVEGGRLELTDSGPGYPADVLEHGPRRFHASGATKGSGLGLTIALKQAESMGASVELGSADHVPGARTVVTFVSP